MPESDSDIYFEPDYEPIVTKKPLFIPKFASRKNKNKRKVIQIPPQNNTGSSIKTKDLEIETPKLETPPIEIRSEFLSIKKNNLVDSEILTPMTTKKDHSKKQINVISQNYENPGSNMIKIKNVKKKKNVYNPSSIINIIKKGKLNKKKSAYDSEPKKIKKLIPKIKSSEDQIKSFSNLNEKDLRKELRENNKRLLENLKKPKTENTKKSFLGNNEKAKESNGNNFFIFLE